MNRTLLDRLYVDMAESGRSWTAAEISEAYLKISAAPALAAKLIRGVFAGDSRFHESGDGLWSSVASPSPSLDQEAYLAAWLDTRAGQTPDGWVLWLRSHGDLSGKATAVRGGDPSSWEHAIRGYSGLRPATVQAGLLGRFQQWMCRRHAVSEWQVDPLDLTAWTRIALVHEGVPPAETLSTARMPGIRERWNLGPASDDDPDGILRSIGELLDLLLERHGSWTESDLHREWESRLAARPVDTTAFAFPMGVLSELPEGCGVYRFYDAGGDLLYVGKAANLARRLRSYFRPYPPERSKREDLMSTVCRFEYDLLSSELEALISETRSIRILKPAWNVQVDVHPPETLPPSWWWPLVFAVPGGDARRSPVFILTGPESGYMLRLPPVSEAVPEEEWTEWLDSLMSCDLTDGGLHHLSATSCPDCPVDPAHSPDTIRGTEAGTGQASGGQVPTPGGVEILEAPESRLALRYYIRHQESLDRVEPCEISDGSSFLRSVLCLVSRDPAGTEPVLPRPG